MTMRLLLTALLLVAAPFIRAQESEVAGAVLCGFALGWALLAILSVRFTDQPQRWAAAPATRQICFPGPWQFGDSPVTRSSCVDQPWKSWDTTYFPSTPCREALWEIFIGVWLIAKGFKHPSGRFGEPYVAAPPTPTPMPIVT